MRLCLFPIVVLPALLVSPALAVTQIAVGGKTYNVEYNTVSGTISNPASANFALMTLDFDPAHVYLFGYEWQSGRKTGLDMFNDIAANTGHGSNITFDLPFGPTFIAGIDYAGNSTTDEYNDLAHYSSWAYFYSDNGGAFIWPELFRADGRALLNGSIDDWTHQSVSASPPDFLPVRNPTPVSGVPEPASLALVALAAPFLVRRKRRIV